MKLLIIIPVAMMANCSAAEVDTAQLDGPPPWALVQERDVEDIKEGDDLTDHYEACHIKVGRLRDKHGITSRFIKTLITDN